MGKNFQEWDEKLQDKLKRNLRIDVKELVIRSQEKCPGLWPG